MLLLPATVGRAQAVDQTAVEAANAGPSISFDLPAAPLDQALIAYGRAANIQVLYDADIVRGQRSSSVKGVLHAREALELLLRGTGLRVRYTTPSAVTLAAVVQAPGQVLQMQAMRVEGSPEIADRRKLTVYIERVEMELLSALQHQRSTNHIAFDLTLHVWLADNGAVARAEVISSTATPTEDATILAVLRGVKGSEPPPPDLPQPIAYRFRSRPGF